MANTYLSKTFSSGNQQEWTWSAWVKKSAPSAPSADSMLFTTGQYGSTELAQIFSQDTLNFNVYDSGGGSLVDVRSSNLVRDPSAWYHFVVAVDTTQATASNRVKLYINGVEASYSSTTYPSQNASLRVNSSSVHNIGFRIGSSFYFNGLMTHIHFTDGTQYQASDFGETDATTGIWKPKIEPSVTYGTNGFFLKFENSGSMGTDSSGETNNFTVNGTLTQTVDTPTNVFATLNGLNVGGGNSTLSNGNTTYSLSNYSYNTRSTLGMPSGKFYWEQKVNATSDVRIGLCTSGFTTDLDTDSVNAYYGGSGGGGVYVLNSGPSTSWQRTNNDTSRNIDTYSTAIASGSTSILMGAVDVDAGKLWVGVDGVWMNSGNPATGANAQITFTNNSGDELQIFAGYGTSSARVSSFNFGNGYFGTTAISSEGINASGNGKFEYDVPTGFTALSTKGLNL